MSFIGSSTSLMMSILTPRSPTLQCSKEKGASCWSADGVAKPSYERRCPSFTILWRWYGEGACRSSPAVDGARSVGRVLFVGDLLHPLDVLAVERVGDGNVKLLSEPFLLDFCHQFLD